MDFFCQTTASLFFNSKFHLFVSAYLKFPYLLILGKHYYLLSCAPCLVFIFLNLCFPSSSTVNFSGYVFLVPFIQILK